MKFDNPLIKDLTIAFSLFVMVFGIVGVSHAATFFADGNNIDTEGGNVTTNYLTVSSPPAQCTVGYAMTYYNGSNAICTLFNASGSGDVLESTITQVAYYNATAQLAGANNMCWNNSAGYLGIGTCTPGAALDVNGDVQIGGVFTAYGSGLSDFSNGDVLIGDLNVSGYLNVDTPAAADCIDFATGGSVCSNTTCTWLASPDGTVLTGACNP